MAMEASCQFVTRRVRCRTPESVESMRLVLAKQRRRLPGRFRRLMVYISSKPSRRLAAAEALAGEPFRFPEGRHGRGELRYLGSLPVLVVGGSFEEMREQIGILALKLAGGLVAHFRQWLEQKGTDAVREAIFLPPRPSINVSHNSTAGNWSRWPGPPTSRGT